MHHTRGWQTIENFSLRLKSPN